MERIEVGEVLKPQGIKGEVKIRHYCDSAAEFAGYKALFLEKNAIVPTAVQSVRQDGEYVYAKLSGVETRDEAENLRGRLLYVEKKALGRLPEDRFYIRDLVGIHVADETGKPLGKIREVLQHGAVDVYCVSAKGGDFMFPALKRVIVSTDTQKGEMVLDKKALDEVAVYED